jgi:hypothetical protein
MAEEFDPPDEVTAADVPRGVEDVALRDILTVNDDFLTRMGRQLIGETRRDRISQDAATAPSRPRTRIFKTPVADRSRRSTAFRSIASGSDNNKTSHRP